MRFAAKGHVLTMSPADGRLLVGVDGVRRKIL